MKFSKFYRKVVEDVLSSISNLKGNLFPFLNYNDLVEPFKTNKVNIKEYWEKLNKFLAESDDQDSVYKKMITENKIETEKVFQDMIGLLFAGHDTTSHGLCSLIYFLKKNPKVYSKLKSELALIEINKDTDFWSDKVRDAIQNWDYLNYVVKETLRFDPPAIFTIPYESNKDIQIWDIPIPKGQKIMVSILSLHYDPEEWQEPLKFIPERFDPESK